MGQLLQATRARAEAPVEAKWARYDAAALVRIPSVKPGRWIRRASSTAPRTRPPIRTSPSPSSSRPGLRGVRGDYELPSRGRTHGTVAAVARRGPGPHGMLRVVARDAGRASGGVVPAQQAFRVGRLPRAGHALRTRALPPAAVNIDVVLCVPSCEGPVRKAFDVTGVTPAVAVTGRLNEVTALEPTDGFRRRRHQRRGLPLHRGHEPLSSAALAQPRRRSDHLAARPLPARRTHVPRRPLRRLRGRTLRRERAGDPTAPPPCAEPATRAWPRASSTADCR
jgi:hypothetical protein